MTYTVSSGTLNSTIPYYTFCCTAGFWHPFSVSILLCPQLPVWVQQSQHHLPNRVVFEFFFSLLLVYLSFCHSAFNNFMQKSVVSQSMANPSTFPLPNRIQYFPVFVYSPENLLISNFIKPADLFHSSPYPLSKASHLLPSVCVTVHVSACVTSGL